MSAGAHLVEVHNALRTELAQLQDLVGQVERGIADAGAIRSHLNTMSLRQNNWTLGAYCASYCRIVTGHHGLEDHSVFPHLRARLPELAPVLDRLQDEHVVIAGLLDGLDQALIALVSRPDGIGEMRVALGELSDTLLAHLSYEEGELVDPLDHHGFY